ETSEPNTVVSVSGLGDWKSNPTSAHKKSCESRAPSWRCRLSQFLSSWSYQEPSSPCRSPGPAHTRSCVLPREPERSLALGRPCRRSLSGSLQPAHNYRASSSYHRANFEHWPL